MAKPSDFFLGVVEFFGILLPGATLVYLLRPFVVNLLRPPDVNGELSPWIPASAAEGWVMFFVLAYIAGHLLHAIGSWLLDDYVYGKLYLPRIKSSHFRTAQLIRQADAYGLRENKEAAATLLARVYLSTGADPTGTNYYDWCLSDVRRQNSAGAIEIDRIQADSKFFRSMAFVLMLAALIAVWESLYWISAVTVVLTFFAIYRFCKLRWTATKRVYEYYLLLHPPVNETADAVDTA